MHSKLLYSIAAAVSAVVLNVAVVTPAHAQVKAALTRDVDRPSAQPVNATCRTFSDAKCILYTVPAGKRLVVETVSYVAYSTSAGRIDSIYFGQDVADVYGFLLPDVNTNIYSVAPVLTSDAAGLRRYNATQPLRAYIDENQRLAAAVYSGGVGAYSTPQTLIFSGYLVDK